jgi:hypothetical protein
MNQSKFNADEILENRLTLMDLEQLLNPFRDTLYSHDDSAEIKMVGPALANAARQKLLKVLEWLEELSDEAEKRESGGLHE